MFDEKGPADCDGRAKAVSCSGSRQPGPDSTEAAQSQTVTLRPYQTEAIQDIRAAFMRGASRVLLQAPTGSEARVKELIVAPGRYRTLVVDPPWDYEWLSPFGRAALGYATMNHEELLALPVESWAEDDAHLYLWVTNSFMTRGVELMARWGFAHKTVLTWCKPRIGLGAYFRNASEHVLFGVRGELRTRSDSISTVFGAPVGAHSEKPERFYEIVREASHPPFGEAFQRQARPDFRSVYRPRETAEPPQESCDDSRRRE